MYRTSTRSAVSRCTKTILPVALILLVFAGQAQSAYYYVVYSYSHYAAVAFSPSTGKYGYAWNQSSKYQAEAQALSNCPASDAKIVGWVNNGWLAVALDSNNARGTGYEYGSGASNVKAAQRAISECAKHGGRLTTLIVLYSGDYAPSVLKY